VQHRREAAVKPMMRRKGTECRDEPIFINFLSEVSRMFTTAEVLSPMQGANADELALASVVRRSHWVVIRGIRNILDILPLLSDLCVSSGQQGAWEDLQYFFSPACTRLKVPHILLLVRRPMLSPQALILSDLLAGVLTFEYEVCGIGTRIFATDDLTGRRTVISPRSIRSEVAIAATRFLMRKRARIGLISYQDPHQVAAASILDFLREDSGRHCSAVQHREIYDSLVLESTFEETLAKLGRHTRRNLRYYRRKAVRDLGCQFVSDVKMSKEEFQDLDRRSSFPVSATVSSARYDASVSSSISFVAGIRDRYGNWLSIVGGKRANNLAELYWQLNLASLPSYSLSTVMRSFLIEHEISLGTKKLAAEGGTPHMMRLSFDQAFVTDIIFRRNNIATDVIVNWAKNVLQKSNFLTQMLISPEIEWRSFDLRKTRWLSHPVVRDKLKKLSSRVSRA
jgi:hypothetical protein